ncbi:hypothetical protein GCM10009727_13430 [Actinomadura napierensis]|uniref:Uncharacterized protein n=1 Tax=Actinomadura napierensis TaxID=267854 RepID=A0ABP5K577_9ACTN
MAAAQTVKMRRLSNRVLVNIERPKARAGPEAPGSTAAEAALVVGEVVVMASPMCEKE